MISLLCEIKNSQIHRNREYNGGYQGLRREKWGDVVKKYKVSVKHNKF